MASILSPSRLIRSQDIQQNSRILASRVNHKKRMASQTNSFGNGSFGLNSVLETMDRFLENNDGNHIVQLLVHLENKTHVSRNALARCLLFIVVCYFLFSIKVFDLAANFLLYFLPSYTSFVTLRKPDVDKTDLLRICRYWMFAGFFITIDPALCLMVPFWSVVKIFLAFQCVLPRSSSLVNGILDTLVTPLYIFLENDSRLASLNQFLIRQTGEQQPEATPSQQ